MTTRSRNIQSVEKAMRLLEQLKSFPDGASLTDLCVADGLTKSTAHGLLNTLVELGYVAHQGVQYRLGARVRAFATANNDATERIRELFSPALYAFNELCESDCFLTVPGGTRSYVILDALDAEGRPFRVVEDSQRDAIRTSAVGKVFLAHDASLARRMRRSALLGPSLEAELVQVRQRGFAFDYQGSRPNLNCLAIPLRLKGQVVGALGTSGVAEQLWPAVLEMKAKRALKELYELVKH